MQQVVPDLTVVELAVEVFKAVGHAAVASTPICAFMPITSRWPSSSEKDIQGHAPWTCLFVEGTAIDGRRIHRVPRAQADALSVDGNSHREDRRRSASCRLPSRSGGS